MGKTQTKSRDIAVHCDRLCENSVSILRYRSEHNVLDIHFARTSDFDTKFTFNSLVPFLQNHGVRIKGHQNFWFGNATSEEQGSRQNPHEEPQFQAYHPWTLVFNNRITTTQHGGLPLI